MPRPVGYELTIGKKIILCGSQKGGKIKSRIS